MDSDDITVDSHNGRFTVTFDRSAKANAITGEMFETLGTIFDELADDPPSVVTIRGADGNFSAGVDMTDVPE